MTTQKQIRCVIPSNKKGSIGEVKIHGFVADAALVTCVVKESTLSLTAYFFTFPYQNGLSSVKNRYLVLNVRNVAEKIHWRSVR